MRAFAIALVCLVFAVGARAGDNPNVNIFLEFDNGQNYISPVPWTPFTATVYLENFGPGGGTTALEFMLVRSFGGITGTAVPLMDGIELGDPDNGWQITGSCELPDGTGRVAVAEVTYFYDGLTPGALEVADHPSAARDVVDCSSGVDSWCVRLGPSGHAGVGVTAPPGDCPAANPCIDVTKEVDCDISKAGDEVIYHICVTNCGDTELFNITVVDDVMGDVSGFFPSSLMVGQTECNDLPYTIQPYDPDPLVNVVMVMGEDAYGNPVNDTDEALVDIIHPSFDVTKVCMTPLVPPGGDAEFEIMIANTGDCDLDIITDEPAIVPFRLMVYDTFVTVVTIPNPGGVPEICNEINVTATIPPEYCDLPNVLMADAYDCCECQPGPYLYPSMLSVLDVGNDQGRKVRLRWLRSLNDAPGAPLPIASYEVYRRQDAQLAKDDIQPDSESTADGVRGGSRIDGWDYVATIPAHGDSVYQAIAPTLCDSTADGGICWSVFLIRGTTSNPYVYFDSPPDSGYSVDNLAPAPPAGLLADGDELLVTLTWDASEEEDFDYYAVYRDVVEDFEPGEPIGLTSEPTYEDTDPPAASAWWYRVAAFDFSGNESEASGSAGAVATGVADAHPTRFWLGPAVPNPFNPVTDIQYWVPSGQKSCHVTLIIHDSVGRVVRHLVGGEIPPGVHVAPWDGRDDGGSLVASGVYFYSMEAGDYANRRRMVLLK